MQESVLGSAQEAWPADSQRESLRGFRGPALGGRTETLRSILIDSYWPIADKEVIPIVEAMAQWPGIRVRHACVGHIPKLGEFYEGYVIVESDTIDGLASLIAALPLDVHFARNELSVADEWIHGSFSMCPSRNEAEIGFVFWFAGSPKDRQRKLLERGAESIVACLHRGSKI